MTEYQIIEELELYGNNVCPFCKSNNIEIYDVSIGEQKLYEFNELAKKCIIEYNTMFILNIDKKLSAIEVRRAGTKDVENRLLKYNINVVKKIISSIPDSKFVSQLKGHFFICLTTTPLEDTKTERLEYVGYSKNELLDIINKFEIENEFQTLNIIHLKNIDNSLIFKGSMFNSWFYADRAKEKLDIPFSNACFNLDENTLVAIGTKSNESPKEFIENNRDKDFIIDENVSPIQRDGKILYYARPLGLDNNG